MARPVMGSDLVNKLSGTEEAKARLKVILDTVAGQRTIEEACAELDISRSRFFELRDRVLQAAVTDLEPKPPGRPAKAVDVEAVQRRLKELEAEQEHLLLELEIAHVREEIRLVFPQYVVDRDDDEKAKEAQKEAGTSGKKSASTRNQRKRRRRRQQK